MPITPQWVPPDGAQGFLRVSRAILAHVRLKGMGEGPGLGDGPKAPGKVRPALKLRAHGLVSVWGVCFDCPTCLEFRGPAFLGRFFKWFRGGSFFRIVSADPGISKS